MIMNRRFFLQTFAGTTATGVYAMGEDKDGNDYGTSSRSSTVMSTIGGQTLRELRDFHQREINEHYLVFWNKHGIDWEYGGFLPFIDENGNYRSTDKAMYYQARGIWVFSYLYNHFGKNSRHLKAARLGKEFIFKHCREADGCWAGVVSREGKPVQRDFNIYGDMYVVLGLGEYFMATGDKEARDTAIETAHSITERITSPAYQHLNTGGYTQGHEPGVKRIGTWQHFLSALTPLSRYTDDYSIQMTARMCVRNILERHYRPELGVALEYLDDMFQPFRHDPLDTNRFVSGWHSIQASWMCMDEALRTGNRSVFMQALEMGRLTLENCWVDGERGGLVDLPNPEAKPKPPDSGFAPSGAMDEALIFALLAIEHTHAPWAVRWFDRIFRHGYSKPDRWLRHCLQHHPRRLFFCVDILDRMIAREGRVSDFLET